MSPEILKSLRELNKFIEKHKLRDKDSNVHFYALIDVEAYEEQTYRQEVEIWVHHQVYNRTAELTFTQHNLDFNYYPTQFFPDFQTFTHVNNSYLEIKGFHSKNPKIGKFVVKIFPK